MTDQKKDKLGMYWMGIVHLVCCGLLIFLIGGVSIGAALSYLQKNFAPLGIALIVTIIGWAGFRLWRRHRMNQFVRSER